MVTFGYLLRFKNASNETFYGEVPEEIVTKGSYIGSTIPVYSQNAPWDLEFRLLDRKETIFEVLSPLPAVPIFIGVGLNYKQHAKEAKASLLPLVVIRPQDALAGPFEDIPINPQCHAMDYEAELCFVIGKDCKNVGDDENAMQYVLGYTAGNDVSSRYWQMPERSGNQHGIAKSFDKFAPIGPVIASPGVIHDPHNLSIKSVVNGEIRQSARTDDLIYDIPTIIRHVSRGTTLRKGTVVMTGTPSGVAAFMDPPAWLQDGDIVEVEIEKIGKIKNKIVFEKL
ncbi:uncharacterized protein PV09_03179 [Verruconis gallopava]|uniref:Fumarylacetoacetase-like C-terminal domain-containing protein n=1 Tax=Verruconis gallopava TaxID=253628 RepID=A0A0D1XTG6_9PEZI|nr:uncharacterized protein PV09_03179 [Verruconis gallopava]KIW05996.1 hypothetical protein PV09_03179 [Verruconis gallopava]